MQLPAELTQGITEITQGVKPADLTRASAELSARYRGERNTRPELDKLHQAAYLTSRLPATYAVISSVLLELKQRMPDLRIESLLDLGAGPGTAMWAAGESFSGLAKIVDIEDVSGWIGIGKQLAQKAKLDAIRRAEWRQGNVLEALPADAFDLVTISYLVNEVNSGDALSLVRKAWERTRKVLLLIDPGTPAGFERVREVRAELIAEGAHVVAPCPHQDQCPMKDGNWCHFAARLERSSEHRYMKRAVLGYEDEKYSYLVVAPVPVPLPSARVLRHPKKHSGHVELELCTPEGLKRETFSKKQGDDYKRMRKAEWGDAVP